MTEGPAGPCRRPRRRSIRHVCGAVLAPGATRHRVLGSLRGQFPRSPYVRPRHQRPAGRPGGYDPLRRARGRPADRRHHRAGGQAAPSRAGVLRPPGAAAPRRPADRARPARRAAADRRRGGTMRVELNHSDPTVLPAGFRLGDNDTRILSVARNLAAEGDDVVLVSKDLPLRVKAASIGLAAEEYRAELAVDSGWTGMAELEVSAEDVEHAVRSTAPSTSRTPGICPATPGWCCCPASGIGARPGPAGQVGAAGARRPGGVRPARPHRRAADRARPAAGPGGRHRLAGRPGRHRQVRAGPVRGPGGGAGAPPAPQGHRLPPAVRGRRPGTGLPARLARPRR